jgi:hypothetical protein
MSNVIWVNFDFFAEQAFTNRKSTFKARLCFNGHCFAYFSSSNALYNHRKHCCGNHYVWTRNETFVVKTELAFNSYLHAGRVHMRLPRADFGREHLRQARAVSAAGISTPSSQNPPSVPAPQTANAASCSEDSDSPAELSSCENMPSSEPSTSSPSPSYQPFSLGVPEVGPVEESKSQAGEPTSPMPEYNGPENDQFIQEQNQLPSADLHFNAGEETEGKGEKPADENDDEDSMVSGPLLRGWKKHTGGLYSAGQGNE